ncbi:MAG: alcohol dehydrogenase catalytic domain-containing protein [Rhodospirillales bacterium]
MRGLWLENRHLGYRDDIPDPAPAEGEAVVRVVRAGICSTDEGLLQGLYPFTGVIGHEFVGVVEDGPDDLRGRRVVGDINAACGACPACRAGRRKHCPNRTTLGIVARHGAFADYVTLPPENLFAVPDAVSTDAAVFTEPLAAALEILERVNVTAGDRVLVAGTGKLGQLICRVMALTGCCLSVLGRNPKKIERLGGIEAETVTPETLKRQTYDLAIEATGNADGLALSLDALRPQGTLVLKSTFPGAVTLDTTRLVVDEITLVGSRCGPFGKALDLLARNEIDPTPLIDGRYPLDAGLAAFEHGRRSGILKILYEIS